MPYIGNKPTDVPLTSEQIQAGSIRLQNLVSGVANRLGAEVGAGESNPFFVNPRTITQNCTLPADNSAMSVGPITINSGVTVTLASGSRWVIL